MMLEKGHSEGGGMKRHFRTLLGRGRVGASQG